MVAMVRDINSEKATLLRQDLAEAPVQLVQGSLNCSQEELERLLSGCTVCISCSGTQRLTKVAKMHPRSPPNPSPIASLPTEPSPLVQLTDVFGGALNDPAHPYNVNYKGIETLCAAMKAQGCSKVGSPGLTALLGALIWRLCCYGALHRNQKKRKKARKPMLC